jgi:hypothetical protein
MQCVYTILDKVSSPTLTKLFPIYHAMSLCGQILHDPRQCQINSSLCLRLSSFPNKTDFPGGLLLPFSGSIWIREGWRLLDHI